VDFYLILHIVNDHYWTHAMQFIVYGKENCPDCKAAVALLKSKGVDPVYLDVMKHEIPTRASLEALAGRPVRTVPIIIKAEHGGAQLEGGEIFIGSFKDLLVHLEGI
jgi:glutaredoxin